MGNYKTFQFILIIAIMLTPIFPESPFCFDLNNIQKEANILLSEVQQNIDNEKADLGDYVYAAVACMKLSRFQEAHKWIGQGMGHTKTVQQKAGMHAQEAFIFSLEKNYIKAVESII